jgi:hypothetical protein
MKALILIFCLIVGTVTAVSQSLHNHYTFNSGGEYTENDTYTSSFSVAGNLVGHNSKRWHSVSHGFQQASLAKVLPSDSTSTSVDFKEEVNIKAYPNPTVNSLKLSFPLNYCSMIKISSIDGKLVQMTSLHPDQNELTVNFTSQAAGNYVVYFVSNEGELVHFEQIVKL